MATEQWIPKVGDRVKVIKSNHSAYGRTGIVVDIFLRRKCQVYVQLDHSFHDIYVMPSSLALTD